MKLLLDASHIYQGISSGYRIRNTRNNITSHISRPAFVMLCPTELCLLNYLFINISFHMQFLVFTSNLFCFNSYIHVICTSSHGTKSPRSRLHWKEVAGPELVNSTVAVDKSKVTPSLIRCTVHIAGFAV